MVAKAVPSTTLTIKTTYLGFNVSSEIGAFPVAPLYLPNERLWITQLAYVINGILKGKTNNIGRCVLSINSDTTTISLPEGLIGKDTMVILIPLTAAAATEFGAGTLYVSDRDPVNKQFTITHVNAATTGRQFGYVLIG